MRFISELARYSNSEVSMKKIPQGLKWDTQVHHWYKLVISGVDVFNADIMLTSASVHCDMCTAVLLM